MQPNAAMHNLQNMWPAWILLCEYCKFGKKLPQFQRYQIFPRGLLFSGTSCTVPRDASGSDCKQKWIRESNCTCTTITCIQQHYSLKSAWSKYTEWLVITVTFHRWIPNIDRTERTWLRRNGSRSHWWQILITRCVSWLTIMTAFVTTVVGQ